MTVRARKLLGMLALVALVVIYALVATAIATAKLTEFGPAGHLAYFFITGMLWVIPAMVIIKWMSGPSGDPG